MAQLVSVIVPIYQVEPYLEKCVDSILAQTYSELEVILVDDGSPDNCGAICDRYAEQDTRVHVVHKENGGVSSARNAGLDAASGTYVMFTDADDCPDPDLVETMVHALEQNDADLVTVDFRAVTPSGTKEKIMSLQDSVRSTEKPDLLKDSRILGGGGARVSIFVWNNLYRTDLIRRTQLRFHDMTEVHSEDQLFNLCYALNVHKAVYIGRSLYSYTKRENTLSHSEKPAELLDRRLTLMRVLREYARRNTLAKQSERYYTLQTWVYFTNGCGALRSTSRITQGISLISSQNLSVLRRCMLHLLFGKVGAEYARSCGMDRRARFYFRFMLILMLLGRYERPVRTYLASEE